MNRFKRLAPLLAFGGSVAVALAPGAFAQEASTPARLDVVFPSDGAIVRSTDIPVRVSVTGFNVACDEAGLPDREGTGHIHVMLDGMHMDQLTNFYCSQNFTISGQGVAPGQHQLIVDLSTSTHADMEDTAKTISFLYQPTVPAAAVPQPTSDAGQTIQITEPASGVTVGPQFTLQVTAPTFRPSCDLEGKANIAGVGHFHVFVDEGMMPMGGHDDMSMPMGQDHDGGMQMMAMPGMISMPCTTAIPVDLSAWPSGQHTINVELEKNDHTPMVEAGGQPKFAQINITLQNPFHP